VHELVSELRQRLEKFNLVKIKPRSEVTQRLQAEDPGELSPKDSLFLKVSLVKPLQVQLYVIFISSNKPCLHHVTIVLLGRFQIIMCGAFYPNFFFKKEIDEVDAMRLLSNHNPANTVVVSSCWHISGLFSLFHPCGNCR
jgi:hypothetical protein